PGRGRDRAGGTSSRLAGEAGTGPQGRVPLRLRGGGALVRRSRLDLESDRGQAEGSAASEAALGTPAAGGSAGGCRLGALEAADDELEVHALVLGGAPNGLHILQLVTPVQLELGLPGERPR